MCTPITPPFSPKEPLADILHGVPIADPYRWLEEQDSPRTRAWIEEQTHYARTHLDNIQGRESIRQRVRELLDVETYDSFLKSGNRYFFRKRLQGNEQPSIYFRDSRDGSDQLLVDPALRGTGDYTAVKPLRVSSDGSLLLYEVKQGGERTGIFEILDVPSRKILPDSLAHGILRGFAFAPDGKGFYYAHEATRPERPFYRAAFHHAFGTDRSADKKVFFAGEDEKLRLILIPGEHTLGFLVYHFTDRTHIDFYIWRMGSGDPAVSVLRDAEYRFAPRLLPGRILAETDHDAPNCRLVDVQPRKKREPLFFDLVRECDVPIRNWTLTRGHIVASYVRHGGSRLEIYDLYGKHIRTIASGESEAIRLLPLASTTDEILLERESFTKPPRIDCYSLESEETVAWPAQCSLFDSQSFSYVEETFSSKDGTSIPIFLAAKREVLREGTHPAVMTSYGGYGVSVTPQFSVLVAYFLERGCVFALPRIRGGAEFGAEWHSLGRRVHRQVVFDDFLAAAEWLIATGRTTPGNLAIFGGSNAGLLVGAALTQRPELFCAVLCLVPLLDMLRYHLFDDAALWREEFGTAEDPIDFEALSRYSPYHQVRQRTAYPAVMLVSGDRDTRCNPLHARKMTACLQAANVSSRPILLDYNDFRGHAAVLPLSVRVAALTDRLAFLCEALGIRPK